MYIFSNKKEVFTPLYTPTYNNSSNSQTHAHYSNY